MIKLKYTAYVKIPVIIVIKINKLIKSFPKEVSVIERIARGNTFQSAGADNIHTQATSGLVSILGGKGAVRWFGRKR